MADLTGRTLGKYRLVERLGRGGMAQVYKAYQPSMDRYVAIKLMHAHLMEDPEFVSMFLDEGRLAASIRHPNVVATLDIEQGRVAVIRLESPVGPRLVAEVLGLERSIVQVDRLAESFRLQKLFDLGHQGSKLGG